MKIKQDCLLVFDPCYPACLPGYIVAFVQPYHHLVEVVLWQLVSILCLSRVNGTTNLHADPAQVAQGTSYGRHGEGVQWRGEEGLRSSVVERTNELAMFVLFALCSVAFPIQKSAGLLQTFETSTFRKLQMFGRIGGQALRCAARRPVPRRKVCDRKFSAHTSYSATPASTPSSPLGSITVELDRIAPRFEIQASQVSILDSPANFYSTLKVSLSGFSIACVLLLLSIANLVISSIGQNTQCSPPCLPVDPLYWQNRA